MNPEPLVRVKTHHALTAAAKRAVFTSMSLACRRFDQLDWRIAVKEVALPFCPTRRRLGFTTAQSFSASVAIPASCKQAFQRKGQRLPSRVCVFRSTGFPACRLRAELAATGGLHLFNYRAIANRVRTLSIISSMRGLSSGRRGN